MLPKISLASLFALSDFELAMSTPDFRYCFWKAHAGCSTSDTDEMLPAGPILGPRCAKSELLRVRLKNKQIYPLVFLIYLV